MGQAKHFEACAISQRKDDTAQTPKRFDWRLALLGKIRKTFTVSIPNKIGAILTHPVTSCLLDLPYIPKQDLHLLNVCQSLTTSLLHILMLKIVV